MVAPFELHWVQRPGREVGRVLRPATLDEALTTLADEPGSRPIAGGTDLLLELHRDGDLEPVTLVDLSGLSGFAGIEAQTSSFTLLGGVTHNDVVAHPGVVQRARPLAQACLEVGSPQLRNRATVAGNLATASPANDTISALVALDASLTIEAMVAGQRRSRRIGVRDFFTGFRSTVLEPHELITAIDVPSLTATQRGVWVKLGLRKAQAISVVHAGVVIDLDPDGVVTAARIALGSVAPTVGLSHPASQALVGRPLDDAAIAATATAAAESVTPIDDVRATAAYRSDTIVTVVERALRSLRATDGPDSWPGRVARLSSRSLPLPDARRAATPPPAAAREPGSAISVTVDGTVAIAEHGGRTLLDWLRDNTGTGTKEGCAEGECGACTVVLDGDAVMSCLVLAAQADGAEVTTVEGLADDDLHPMQASFVEQFAVQCGYCIPGFVVAAATLADELDSPERSEVELAMAGNLCRCTGYYTIIDAIRSAGTGE